MSEVEINNVQPHDGKPHVKCRCKKVVVEYFVALTPDGYEVEIRGIDKKDLKDGLELVGTIEENYVQQQYENGEWSRSYAIEKWLDVSNGI